MRRVRRTAAVVVLVAAGFGSGWFANGVLTSPDCPAEDSCTVDYRDGRWHITEVTP